MEENLKEEIERRRREKIKKLAERLSELMKNVTPEEFTRLVKETRYERWYFLFNSSAMYKFLTFYMDLIKR